MPVSSFSVHMTETRGAYPVPACPKSSSSQRSDPANFGYRWEQTRSFGVSVASECSLVFSAVHDNRRPDPTALLRRIGMESAMHDATKIASNRMRFEFSMPADVVRHSQIVCETPAATRLPAGFDGVHVAILEWIADEGRRLGRKLLPI